MATYSSGFKQLSYWTKRRRVQADVYKQIQAHNAIQDEQCDLAIAAGSAAAKPGPGAEDLQVNLEMDFSQESVTQDPTDNERLQNGGRHHSRGFRLGTESEDVFADDFDSDEYSPEVSSESDSEHEADLKEKLAQWAVSHKISHVALASLL